jgi:hypothetical protein
MKIGSIDPFGVKKNDLEWLRELIIIFKIVSELFRNWRCSLPNGLMRVIRVPARASASEEPGLPG